MNALRTPRRTCDAGFTLVEVLVALAVLGLISLLATEALSFSVRSWRESESRASAVQRNLAAYDLIRDQLLVALPYYGSPNDPDRVSSFRGDRNGLRVATRGPLALGQRGIVWFSVTAGRSAGGSALNVSWAEDHEGALSISPTSGESQSTLLENLETLEFSYFGEASSGSRPQWMDSWLRQDRPPDLVRISATFPRASNGDWPDLIVHIRTDMSSRCRFDQVSRICRLF